MTLKEWLRGDPRLVALALTMEQFVASPPTGSRVNLGPVFGQIIAFRSPSKIEDDLSPCIEMLCKVRIIEANEDFELPSLSFTPLSGIAR